VQSRASLRSASHAARTLLRGSIARSASSAWSRPCWTVSAIAWKTSEAQRCCWLWTTTVTSGH